MINSIQSRVFYNSNSDNLFKNLIIGILLFSISLLASSGIAQSLKKEKSKNNKGSLKQSKMKVEIWSDVMCPFCYIGKRKFEKALSEFSNKDNVEIVWKSFQLNADMKTNPTKSTYEYLAETKGWTLDYARQMGGYVTEMAALEGLVYNMDKTVVANSFDAHRFIQLAKKNNKGDEAEEQLFKAYFTEGKNIADHLVLTEIGNSIGLDSLEVKELLNSTLYADLVQKDIYEARQVGARGVPFFVFNKKHAVSGAQDAKVLLSSLEKAWKEFEKETAKAGFSIVEGAICNPEGDCEPQK